MTALGRRLGIKAPDLFKVSEVLLSPPHPEPPVEKKDKDEVQRSSDNLKKDADREKKPEGCRPDLDDDGRAHIRHSYPQTDSHTDVNSFHMYIHLKSPSRVHSCFPLFFNTF